MKIIMTKTELGSKGKVREKLKKTILASQKIAGLYNENEIFGLLLSAIRANEFGIVDAQEFKNRVQFAVDTESIRRWIKDRLTPNTIQINLDDKEFLKFLIFSLAMPYKMIRSETKATMSEKVRRGKKRDFEQIFSDTFIGKIGEVIFKHFAKQRFGKDVALDWSISREIGLFKSDVANSKKVVSIKSTDTLESVWAEAPKNADYGIFIKVSLPKDFFMKILAHISSLEKLLNFVSEKIQDDKTASSTMELVNFIKETAYGERMVIKAFVCGFFKTQDVTLKHRADKLPYIGGKFEVYEDKHVIRCDQLKCTDQEWNEFFNEVL